MIWTLQGAANYVRSGNAPRVFIKLLNAIRRVFNFDEERRNRVARYVEITRDYKAGVPVATIEAKYKCSRQTINRYRTLAGLPKRDKGFDDDKRSAVIAMYKAGKPLVEIQTRLGVSQSYISTVATQEGINRRPRKK